MSRIPDTWHCNSCKADIPYNTVHIHSDWSQQPTYRYYDPSNQYNQYQPPYQLSLDYTPILTRLAVALERIAHQLENTKEKEN
jgi:hypothetical protein